MAILEFFEAAVSINGQRAAEYDDDDSETKTSPNSKVVTKYVEAVAGTNFALDISVKKDYTFDCDYISFNVNLDGTSMSGRVMSPDYARLSQIGGVKGQENGQMTLRKFKFGDLAISEFAGRVSFPISNRSQADDGSVSSLSEEKIKYLGMIRVEVYRYMLNYVNTESGERHSISAREESVPEKALKGRAVTLTAG